MAKRLVSTEKWKKPWFKKLPTKFKVIWDYLYLDCDCAGVWTIDIDLLCFQTNEKVTIGAILETFKEQIYQIDSTKLLLVPFFNDQYAHTKDGFSAKRKAVEILSSYGIEITNNRTTYPPLGGDYPPCGGSVGGEYKYSIGIGIGNSIGIGKEEQSVEIDTVIDYTHPLEIEPEVKPMTFEEKAEGIAKHWNQLAELNNLPKVKLPLSKDRIASMKPAMAEFPAFMDWHRIMVGVTDNDFNLGDNDRKWKANFDWLFYKTKFNYRKLWESSSVKTN